MSSEPVEIKVTVSGGVPEALGTLGLDQGTSLQIWFLEDLTDGLREALPLLAAGVILRLRSWGDKGDSTVKLRPCRRSQLTEQWATADEGDGWEHRIEADWAGARRVLATSSALDLPADRVVQAVAGLADLGTAFGGHQRDFLAECADLRVNFGGLTPLGPIAATRWKDVDLGLSQDVNAERWVVGDLDFLELSIRVKPDEADPPAAQSAFEAAVRAAGLQFPSEQVPKTERVLRLLAAQTAG